MKYGPFQPQIEVHMAKNTMKLTWLLLLFVIFCPIEILGQYASPYLNPLTTQTNPGSIVWREKSTVGVTKSNQKSDTGKPLTQRETDTVTALLISNTGEFFGYKSGFEFLIGEHIGKMKFYGDNSYPPANSEAKGVIFDKTGGFAI